MTRNVVVVMLDTLQFNYLGCYGNPWIRTPNIDRFSQQGVLFAVFADLSTSCKWLSAQRLRQRVAVVKASVSHAERGETGRKR